MTEAQAQLEALAVRLVQRGYRSSNTQFFGGRELFVFTAPVEASEGFSVIERSVFLYHLDGGWIARVTLHGGPHWIRHASTCGELEAIALQALTTADRPPSHEWTRDE